MDVLRTVPLRDLQIGIRYQRPYRDRSRTNWQRTENEYREFRSQGTRIPQWILGKFASGEWNPSQRTIDKLYRFSRNYNYHLMRSVGAPTREATRHKNKPPEEVMAMALDYKDYIRAIAANKGLDEEWVEWGMTLSDHPFEYWEEYTETTS